MDVRALFGTNLRHLRKGRGFTQAALARKAGVDRAYISSMERGRQNITLLTLWHIAQALEVEPASLLARALSVPGK